MIIEKFFVLQILINLKIKFYYFNAWSEYNYWFNVSKSQYMYVTTPF